MNRKNDVQVTINGKVYSIAGYENTDYLHRIADYLNRKQNELKEQYSRNITNDSERNVLMLINIADDYLKLKERTEELSGDDVMRQKEVASVKRKLAAQENTIQEYEKEKRLMQADNIELQKRIVRLETELDSLKKGF